MAGLFRGPCTWAGGTSCESWGGRGGARRLALTAAMRTWASPARVRRGDPAWGKQDQWAPWRRVEAGPCWALRALCPQVFPVTSSGAPVSEYPFVRTGLLGFVGPGGLVFVVGKMDGLMVVSGRRHNADDIVATALAVEPMKFVYRGR